MILSLSGIVKRFNNRIILDDLSFNVEKGCVFALCGASGSGKTTIVRIVSGLLSFDSGFLQIAESRINALDAYPRHLFGKIGVIFQEHNLFPHLNARDNVSLALRKVRHISHHHSNERALKELESVGLVDKAGQYPSTLSGGERQRVAIARALAMDPLLLLLDEPTSSLDTKRISEVLDTIENLSNNGVTMLLITHNLGFAKKTASKFGVLSNGKCVTSNESSILNCLNEEVFE